MSFSSVSSFSKSYMYSSCGRGMYSSCGRGMYSSCGRGRNVTIH